MNELLQTDILNETDLQTEIKNRKSLLPRWIKFFSWIFLIFGVLSLIVLVLGLMGKDVALSLYGLETNKVFSLTGIIITSQFILKGITAYSLLKEKDKAIQLAIIDAISGIAICMLAMFLPTLYPGSGINSSFKLELLLLFPYLIKMVKIQSDWKNAIPFRNHVRLT